MLDKGFSNVYVPAARQHVQCTASCCRSPLPAVAPAPRHVLPLPAELLVAAMAKRDRRHRPQGGNYR